MAFDFSISAKTVVRVFGSTLVYKQGAQQREFPIDIEHDLEVIDRETGVSQVVTAATFTRADFEFGSVKKGDQILDDAKVWKVVRVLEQDQVNITVELGK